MKRRRDEIILGPLASLHFSQIVRKLNHMSAFSWSPPHQPCLPSTVCFNKGARNPLIKSKKEVKSILAGNYIKEVQRDTKVDCTL